MGRYLCRGVVTGSSPFETVASVIPFDHLKVVD